MGLKTLVITDSNATCVDMGTVPQGLSLNIQGSQNGPYPLVAGTNTFTFDAWFPTPGMNAIVFVRADGAPFPVDYRFSIDNVAISQVNTITVNKINHVADYFPYGKIVRKFVEGDEERFLTTQHERDEETGLDYRGEQGIMIQTLRDSYRLILWRVSFLLGASIIT